MLKKFGEGLAFGAGFAISFVPIWYIAAYLIFPLFFPSQTEREPSGIPSEIGTTNRLPSTPNTEATLEPAVPFHELQIEDKIKQSSVIALAKYEPGPDGRMRAIIKEYLKKAPNVTIQYTIGDEFQSASYYPSEKTNRGDGVVIFFVGSPATMRMSMSFSGDRILSLGDMPIELFKKKCGAPDA